MASYVVDGLVLPVSVGGHPVLDFCNTRAGWGAPTPKEYLQSYPHLARWAAANGLLSESDLPRLARTAKRSAAAARAVTDRAIALRDALYAVLVTGRLVTGGLADGRRVTGGLADGGGARAWSVINREVRAAGATATLAYLPHGPAPAAWRLAATSVEAPLAAVAWSAAGFLTTPAASAVGACPGAGCGWVFADPRGRRRWCSMAWCGNRAKARRHAQRQRIMPQAAAG